jgi:hypothetical protein
MPMVTNPVIPAKAGISLPSSEKGFQLSLE